MQIKKYTSSIYKNYMMIELKKAGLIAEAEKPVSVTHENDNPAHPEHPVKKIKLTLLQM